MTEPVGPHGMVLQLVTAYLHKDLRLFAELMAETTTRDDPTFVPDVVYLLVSSSAMAQMSTDEWEQMLTSAWAQVHRA